MFSKGHHYCQGLIEINTAINPVGRGIGFAIPINMAKRWCSNCGRRPCRARYLGVVIQTMSSELASKFEVAENGGVLIGDILRGSPAENAGLKRGDVILDFAGRPVQKMQELQRLVAATRPGTPVGLKIRRESARATSAVEIGELKDLEPKGEAAGHATASPWMPSRESWSSSLT